MSGRPIASFRYVAAMSIFLLATLYLMVMCIGMAGPK